MPESTAVASWHGSLTDGDGDVALESGVWSGTYATPELQGVTDPEELLAAGQASCFAMVTAYLFEETGFEAKAVDVEATVTLEQDETGFSIPDIDLDVEAEVPDAGPQEVWAVIDQAERACPVSQALSGPTFNISASLAEE